MTEVTEALKKAWTEKNILFLSSFYFNFKPSPTQEEIIRIIAFQEKRRICISAYTRYGKTKCVSIGIALLILGNKDKKIMFVAPQEEQAKILRDYMTGLVLDCPFLFSLAHLETKGVERLRKEASKARQTFKNGCEYRILSAHGDAERAMGHGADIIVMDEAALISREAYAKITRMLGDDPENSVLIELFNPWTRDCKAFEHSISENFYYIQVPWQVGVEEGRTTKAHIEEQKADVSPLDFTVLYDSQFPDQSEDSLFSLTLVEKAERLVFGFEKELEKIEKDLSMPQTFTEAELSKIKKAHTDYMRVISCDVAEMGRDKTVISWGIRKGNSFEVLGVYSEAKSDPMGVVGKIMSLCKDFIGYITKGVINIDKIGIGSGTVSRCSELVEEQGFKNVNVHACHFGEQAIKKDEYLNRKAENYYRLESLIREGMISIAALKHTDLKKQLIAMRWERTSSSKKRIIDPDDYSPDFADSLVYFVWKDMEEFTWAFV